MIRDVRFKNQSLKERLARRRASGGFTLLETVIALSVILAAVVGPVSLITRGIVSFSFAKDKLIAANLAQEGMELVRAIRDNNILCDELDNGVLDESWIWNQDPQSPPGTIIGTGTYIVGINSRAIISCGGRAFGTFSLSFFLGEKIKFENDPLGGGEAFGFYGYQGKDTIFTRVVTICTPPTDASPCESAPDADIPPQDQMDVITKVTWQERGAPQSMTLRERLYNWR